MTLANRLTILRIALALAMFAALMQQTEAAHLLAFILFLAAIITDWIDGVIARMTHSVSAFGKVADPIADKILVIGALIGLLRAKLDIPLWGVFLIVVREILVGGIRVIASSEKGVIIAADRWGKLKMVIQSVSVLFMIGILVLRERLPLPDWVLWLPYPLTVICVIFAWSSAFHYVRQTRKILEKSWS